MRGLRKCFEPHTSSKLRDEKRSSLKDYVSVADQFKISHFMVFTQTENGIYLKISRYKNKGPTVHFKVVDYTLFNRNQTMVLQDPFISFTGFRKDDELLDYLGFVNTHTNDDRINRTISFHREESKIYVRHYVIKREMGNSVRIELEEIGPRMTLEIFKIEDGFFCGEVVYHAYIKKSAEEKEKIARRKGEREELRVKRREEQERNVEKKKKERRELRVKRREEQERNVEKKRKELGVKKRNWEKKEEGGQNVRGEEED
jgi:hypothetical protein